MEGVRVSLVDCVFQVLVACFGRLVVRFQGYVDGLVPVENLPDLCAEFGREAEKRT